MRSALVAMLLVGALGACGPDPTRFHGSPNFPGGPKGCQARCAGEGLEMSGYVYSGEFATSCVCRPATPRPGSAAPAGPAALEGSGSPESLAGEATAVGVDVQSEAAAAAAASARLQQVSPPPRKR